MTSVSQSSVSSLVETVRPREGQHAVWALRGAALIGLLLGCSGVLAEVLFHQQSLAKWAVTVAGPLVVLGLTLSKRPVTYLAMAVVAALPFLQVGVSFKGQSLPLAAPVLIMAVVVAFVVQTHNPVQPVRPPVVPVATSVIRAGAVVAVALLLPWALRGTAAWMWFLQVVVVMAIGYVMSRAWVLDADAKSLILPVFAGTLALQGLLAVQEYRSGRPLNFYGGQSSYGSAYFFSYGDNIFRPSGSFYDPISLGNVLALGLPILLVLSADPRAGFLVRCWYGLCGVVAAGALVLTYSRMSWIGAALGLVVVVLLSPAGERLRQLALLLVASVAVAGTAVALAGASLAERFGSIFDPTGLGVKTARGDETRQQFWSVARDVFLHHPTFGIGRGELNAVLVSRVQDATIFSHAHSTYLQFLAEAGLLGGAALLVLGLVAVVQLSRTLRAAGGNRQVLVRGCAGAIVAIAVVWSTDYTVRFTGVLAFMALPLILLHATRSGRRAPALEPTPTGLRNDELVGQQP